VDTQEGIVVALKSRVRTLPTRPRTHRLSRKFSQMCTESLLVWVGALFVTRSGTDGSWRLTKWRQRAAPTGEPHDPRSMVVCRFVFETRVRFENLFTPQCRLVAKELSTR